jgi:hypothetical protein
MGVAYAHPFRRRPMLKRENGVMWSEIHRLVIKIITTVWTVTPPSALIGLIGERHVRHTGAITDMMCSNA